MHFPVSQYCEFLIQTDIDYVNQEIEKLKKGDIKVPKDKKEYDAMMK